MTLQKIVQMLRTAPATQIDAPIMEKILAVDIENEQAVRDLLQFVYESGFYASVTPFVATLVDPRFIKDYPFKA